MNFYTSVRPKPAKQIKAIIFNDLLGVHDHTKYEHLISFARAHKLKTKSDNFNHVF